MVWDRYRQRVTVLAPDGRVVRTASALGCPPREGSQPGACYEPVDALDDGTVVMASGPSVYAEGREIGVKLGRPIELGAPLDGEWRRVAEVHQGDQFWARASIPGLAFAVIHPYPRLHGGRGLVERLAHGAGHRPGRGGRAVRGELDVERVVVHAIER